MNIQSKDNKHLVVGYASPGWPPSDFPNGIVTYIQNILSGYDPNYVKPIIFSHNIGSNNSHIQKDQIINLSDFSSNQSIFNALNRVLNLLPDLNKNASRYQRGLEFNAQSFSNAIRRLEMPLDLLEIEESFGIAYFLKKKTNIPVVVRLHGSHFILGEILKLQRQWDYKCRVHFEGKAIEIANGITAPSQDMLNKVRSYYNLPLENADVIPNPVLPTPEHLLWKHNSKVRPNILFVGRFDLIKGADLIINAFRIVASINKDVVLNFVGPDNGINIEGELVKFDDYVSRTIPEIDIKSRINFLGQCDSKTIAKLRSRSTVTVISSRYETFGLTLTEALSAGSPCIATAVGGIKEIVIDGFNGRLVDLNSEAIADSIVKLLDNLMDMKLFSRNSIEDCNKRFSPQLIAKKTFDYYQSILLTTR